MTTPYDGISALPKGIESTMFLKKLSEVDCTRDYIIIVDRSASMRLKGRWKEAEEACKVLCHHACKCDENGITLYFFSSHSITSKSETPAFTKYENVITGHDVMKQFESKVNAPHGGTDLTSVLKDAFISPDGKPLSILVITDGMPDAPGEVSQLIKETANNMTKPDDIYVTIIQVGDDHKADLYLNELDEGLEKLGCKYDIVDVISHQMMLNELNESGGKFSKLIETSVIKAEETIKTVVSPSISPPVCNEMDEDVTTVTCEGLIKAEETIETVVSPSISPPVCNEMDEDVTTVTCEGFVMSPMQETAKVATKIASTLMTEIQGELTLQNISDKPTWSDAHISDDMNEEKSYKLLSTSKKSLKSFSSLLCGHIAMTVCMIVKQICTLMLGEGTVAYLEKNMSPMPVADARYAYHVTNIVII